VPARVRWTGTTTQRGYGHGHQAERERRLAAYRPGDPCAHCGRPITWPLPLTTLARQRIHLPHNATRTGYLPGLSHAACNLRDGAVRGNKMRARRPMATLPLRTSRRW
jgi:hypothetical protein